MAGIAMAKTISSNGSFYGKKDVQKITKEYVRKINSCAYPISQYAVSGYTKNDEDKFIMNCF